MTCPNLRTQEPKSCFALTAKSKQVVKTSSLLEGEHLEKVETLQIKLQVVTQSRPTAMETAESPLLLDMPGRSHL